MAFQQTLQLLLLLAGSVSLVAGQWTTPSNITACFYSFPPLVTGSSAATLTGYELDLFHHAISSNLTSTSSAW